VAYNLRLLGANVTIAGLVGHDDNAKHLTDTLQKSGVNTSGLITDPNRPTTTKTRVMGHTQYRQQQQMLRIDREESDPIDVEQALNLTKAINESENLDAIFISDYAKGVVTNDLMNIIVDMARKRSLPTIVDPKGRNFEKYQGVTAISPNQSEALGVFNIDDADEKTVMEIGHRLAKQFEIDQVVMTRSEQGVALFDSKGLVAKIPATARDVFDVSGAGDSTAAVYTLALLSGASPVEAAYIGNLAGGIVVGKVGVDTVSIEEITEAHHIATNT